MLDIGFLGGAHTQAPDLVRSAAGCYHLHGIRAHRGIHGIVAAPRLTRFLLNGNDGLAARPAHPHLFARQPAPIRVDDVDKDVVQATGLDGIHPDYFFQLVDGPLQRQI